MLLIGGCVGSKVEPAPAPCDRHGTEHYAVIKSAICLRGNCTVFGFYFKDDLCMGSEVPETVRNGRVQVIGPSGQRRLPISENGWFDVRELSRMDTLILSGGGNGRLVLTLEEVIAMGEIRSQAKRREWDHRIRAR